MSKPVCIYVRNQSEYDAHKDDPRACLHVTGDLDVIRGGSARVMIQGSAQIGKVGGRAQITEVCDSAQIHLLRRDATVTLVRGHAQIHEVWDSAHISIVRDSARIGVLRGFAGIADAGGSAQIAEVCDYARITVARDSAHIYEVRGEAQIHEVRGEAQIHAVAGTAVVHAYGGTITSTGRYATVYRHDPAAQIAGPAHVIGVPVMNEDGGGDGDAAEWAAFAGARIEREHMIVWTAADANLRSAEGVACPVGAKVTVLQPEPDYEFAYGLTFAATAAAASARAYAIPGAKRYLACRVALVDAEVIDGGAIEAPECLVLYETDIAGEPIPAVRHAGDAT